MKALKQQKVLYYCFEKLKLPFLKKISSRFNHHADHVYLLRAWLPYCCLFSNRSFSMHLIQYTWYAHMIHSMHLHHMYMQFSITYTTSKNNAYMKMSPERGKFYQNVYFYIMLGRWLCFPMFLKWNKMANYTEKKNILQHTGEKFHLADRTTRAAEDSGISLASPYQHSWARTWFEMGVYTTHTELAFISCNITAEQDEILQRHIFWNYRENSFNIQSQAIYGTFNNGIPRKW